MKCNYHLYMEINYRTKDDRHNRYWKFSTTCIPLLTWATDGYVFGLTMFKNGCIVWLPSCKNQFCSFCISISALHWLAHHLKNAWTWLEWRDKVNKKHISIALYSLLHCPCMKIALCPCTIITYKSARPTFTERWPHYIAISESYPCELMNQADTYTYCADYFIGMILFFTF